MSPRNWWINGPLRTLLDVMGQDQDEQKLGFIAQEIGREINTLGSKANDADMQRIVVQMKDELEIKNRSSMPSDTHGKAVIFSAPSRRAKPPSCGTCWGTRSSTWPSASAPTRPPAVPNRTGWTIILTVDAFKERIVLERCWSGRKCTRASSRIAHQLERLWAAGKTVIFDVDVVGGANLRRLLGDSALAVFIQPPSLEVLHHRLESRGTDDRIGLKNGWPKLNGSWSSTFTSTKSSSTMI